MLMKLIVRLVIVAFWTTTVGPLPDTFAQTIINLPAPGAMVNPSRPFEPLQFKGILVDPRNPLRFDFLVDKGDAHLYGQNLKDNITRLSKYFLTCLTIPEDDLWVNLSPYEKDRIVPGQFGITLMGKDLLEQDYLLKQIMASLSYPENELGKIFWQKVYRKSYELFGTTEIPINTFNKVWIVPQYARVYAQGNAAFVIKSQLDVMLEADYKSYLHHQGLAPDAVLKQGFSNKAGAYSQVFRDVILPQLRDEVNQGRNFAVVRQVFNAMILATWYKRHLKDSVLGRMYVGKNQVSGVDILDKHAKEKIYRQYLKAYKKCVYNYIKEDYDPITRQTVPRKYASGGLWFAGFGKPDSAMYTEVPSALGINIGSEPVRATVDVTAKDKDGAMIAFPPMAEITHSHPFHFTQRQADSAMVTLGTFSRTMLMSMTALIGLLVMSPSLQAAQVKHLNDPRIVQVVITEKDIDLGLGGALQKAGYTRMPLWGEHGAVAQVARIARITDVDNVNARDTFNIPTPQALKAVLQGRIPESELMKISGVVARSTQAGIADTVQTAPPPADSLTRVLSRSIVSPAAAEPPPAPPINLSTTGNGQTSAAAPLPPSEEPLVGRASPTDQAAKLKPPDQTTVRSAPLPDELALLPPSLTQPQLPPDKTTVKRAPPLAKDLVVEPSSMQTTHGPGTALPVLTAPRKGAVFQEPPRPLFADNPGWKPANYTRLPGAEPPPPSPVSYRAAPVVTTQSTPVLTSNTAHSGILQYSKMLPWVMLLGILGISMIHSGVAIVIKAIPRLKERKARQRKPKEASLAPMAQQSAPSSGWAFSVAGPRGPTLTDDAERAWIQAFEAGEPVELPTFPNAAATISAPTANGQTSDKSSLRFMDMIGMMAGGAVASYFGGDYSDLGRAFLESLMATPILYTGLLLLHEAGHLTAAFLQYLFSLFSASKFKNVKILTWGNLTGNLGFKGLLLTALPFIKSSRLAGVDLPWLEGKSRRINQAAGFFLSLGAVCAAFMAGIHFDLWPMFPHLFGSLSAASLFLLIHSFYSDIKEPSSSGRINCGNGGFIFLPEKFMQGRFKDVFFPEDFQIGLANMKVWSELRGDQGKGIFTWGVTKDGDVVPIIYKVMKSKRGPPVIVVAIYGFDGRLRRVSARDVRPLPGAVREIVSHDRFLTQGVPSLEGLQPQLSRSIQRILSFFDEEGRPMRRLRTIAAAVTLNGDLKGYQYRGKIMATGQVKEYFGQKLHMKKDVYIPPTLKQPKGYYAYWPSGDTPGLAGALHFHDNQGDFEGASSFSLNEIFYHDWQESLEHNLSEEEDQQMGAFLLNAYTSQIEEDSMFNQRYPRRADVRETYEQVLLRPGLKKIDKTLGDCWVTAEMVAQDPRLEIQHLALESLRQRLKRGLLEQARLAAQNPGASPVGRILNQLQALHADENFEQKVERYADMSIQRFFTADIMAAMQEIEQRGIGTFGVRALSSKYPGRGIFWTKGQSIALGINKEAGYISYNSEHTALMTSVGDAPPVNEILILNSYGRGQITETYYDHTAQELKIRAYSPRDGRDLSDDDLKEWRMELTPDNPYYAALVQRDLKNVAQEDVNDIARAIRDVQARWRDPNSFVRRTMDPFFQKSVSRMIEGYIKENSKYYNVSQGYLMAAVESRAAEVIRKSPKRVSPENSKRLIAALIRSVGHDERILSYLKSHLDQQIALNADSLTKDLMNGDAQEDDLFLQLRTLDASIKVMRDAEIAKIAADIAANNLEFLTQFETAQRELTQQQERIARIWEPSTEGLTSIPEHESIGSGEADFFISGLEDSLWLGSENFKRILEIIFPGAVIETDSTNKALNLKPNDRRKVGKRTICLVVSKSGATSPSKNLVPILEAISPGNVFIMTGRVDTLMALSLGQRFYKGAEFNNRIFPTGNFYPSEVNSVSLVEMMANQVEMIVYMTRGMKRLFPNQRPWKMNLMQKHIGKIVSWRDAMLKKAVRLTGVNEDGMRVLGYKEHESLVENSEIFGNMMTETTLMNVINGLFVFSIFYLGYFSKLGALIDQLAGMPLAFTWSGGAVFALFCTTLTLAFGWAAALIYRQFTHRVQKKARLGKPTMVIGDTPAVHQSIEINASKRGSLAIKSQDVDYHGGNPIDHLGARFIHRLRRGTVLLFGLPENPQDLENIQVTLNQSLIRTDMTIGQRAWDWIGRHILAGPETFTIGHGEADPNLSQHHMNIGELETVDILPDGSRVLKPDITQTLSQIYSDSFELIDRIIAYNVFLTSAYEYSTGFKIWFFGPVFRGMAKILRATRIWKYAPDKFHQQDKTHSRTAIFSTPSPADAPTEAQKPYHDAHLPFSILDGTNRSGVRQLEITDSDDAQVSNPPKRGGIDMNSRLMRFEKTRDKLQ